MIEYDPRRVRKVSGDSASLKQHDPSDVHASVSSPGIVIALSNDGTLQHEADPLSTCHLYGYNPKNMNSIDNTTFSQQTHETWVHPSELSTTVPVNPNAIYTLHYKTYLDISPDTVSVGTKQPSTNEMAALQPVYRKESWECTLEGLTSDLTSGLDDLSHISNDWSVEHDADDNDSPELKSPPSDILFSQSWESNIEAEYNTDTTQSRIDPSKFEDHIDNWMALPELYSAAPRITRASYLLP